MFAEIVGRVTSPAMDEYRAAEYIGVSVQWLRNNRRSGIAPPCMKYGSKTIRYHRDDLEAWMKAQRLA